MPTALILLAWATPSSRPLGTSSHMLALPRGWSQAPKSPGSKGSSAIGTWIRAQTLPLDPGLPHPDWPGHFSSKKLKNNVPWMEIQGPDRGLQCESSGWRDLPGHPHPNPAPLLKVLG